MTQSRHNRIEWNVLEWNSTKLNVPLPACSHKTEWIAQQGKCVTSTVYI